MVIYRNQAVGPFIANAEDGCRGALPLSYMTERVSGGVDIGGLLCRRMGYGADATRIVVVVVAEGIAITADTLRSNNCITDVAPPAPLRIALHVIVKYMLRDSLRT